MHVVYRTIIGKDGKIEDIDLLELVQDQRQCNSLYKFYTKQIPSDLSDRIRYHTAQAYELK